MEERLREARRVAAWAPDAARELVVSLTPVSDRDQAEAAEVLGRVFAVTSAWPLAAAAFEEAAAMWDTVDPARALAARATAKFFPLLPFATDREAVVAEVELVARCVRGEGVALRRTIAELRRGLVPRRVTGEIEAAFRLSPGELALVMAAVVSTSGLLETPLRTAAEWRELLSIDASAERLIEVGLLVESALVVPHPSVASRLLGRVTIDQPSGIRIERVTAIQPTTAIRIADDRVAVIYGAPRSGRRTFAANVAGRPVFAARRVGTSPDIASARREAALHSAILLIDLDEWGGELDAFGGPLIAIARTDPAIPEERRAFTIRTWRDEVGSPR